MNLLQIALLAVVQGLAELLPVSSSAHVILAEKLLRLDPTDPAMTLFLVALHTGTMFSVLVYFWDDWKNNYFASREKALAFLKQVVLATVVTLGAGFILMKLIEKVALRATPNAEVEMLFGNLKLISIALAAAGALIIFSSRKDTGEKDEKKLGPSESSWIGLVQGLCLPFRGFSRSGATISAGLLLGLARRKAEEFSFALALAVTPFALGKEILRFWKAQSALDAAPGTLGHLVLPSLLGTCLSFAAGLLALEWLSSWLEKGRWKYFGFYCLAASILVWVIQARS